MPRNFFVCSLALLPLITVIPVPTQAASSVTGKCIAAFDFELIDLSLEGQVKGVNDAEQQRLLRISSQFRDWLKTEGYPVCDTSPIASDVKSANLYGCGCVQRLAARVDAGLAVTGVVQKVSNLILDVEVEVLDVGANKPVVKANAQFRSNTDESWKLGLNWLIKNRLAQALAFLAGNKQ